MKNRLTKIPVNDSSSLTNREKRGGPKQVWKVIKNNSKKLLAGAMVLALIFFGYNYVHTRDQLNKLRNPQIAAQNDTQAIIARIDKTVTLPNETPALATVKDASKFKNSSLFTQAKNGDKVLIYSKSNLAVLYRPSTQKVVELVPVGSGTNQQ